MSVAVMGIFRFFVCLLLLLLSSASFADQSQNNFLSVNLDFEMTGAPQTFIVPDLVNVIRAEIYGAQGGDPDFGGLGGKVFVEIPVSIGEELTLYVGAAGYGHNETGLNGFNGGGNDGDVLSGGGASDIRKDGNSLSNRIVVAGGGGQRGLIFGEVGFIPGGNGGGLVGATGSDVDSNTTGGNGGTQADGGIGGCGSIYCRRDGALGSGGPGDDNQGHGGGGYYGGGGGGSSGGIRRGAGGGGSSFISPDVIEIENLQGVKVGDGLISISFNLIDSDNDGIPDNCTGSCLDTGLQSDTDADNDGLPNDYETANGLNPVDASDAQSDSDMDGLTALEEFNLGTSPTNDDTDRDTLPDAWEVENGRDPLVADYDLSVSQESSCAIDDGGVICWGRNDFYQTDVPELMEPKRIYAGDLHVCATDNAGITCWGQNDWNQLNAPNISDVSKLSLGGQHSCAISDGEVFCWGRNSEGQTNIPELNNVTDIATGWNHSCAISDSGVSCWGLNDLGQIDVPVLINPKSIYAGVRHTCAIDDNGAVCWGNNEFGQSDVPQLNNVKYLSLGWHHTCAIDGSQVICWGDNSSGRINPPQLDNPQVISSGYHHTCSLSNEGVSCWGDNTWNQSNVPSLVFDPDLDGIDSSKEISVGLDALINQEDLDSDGDGISDQNEILMQTNPLDASSKNIFTSYDRLVTFDSQIMFSNNNLTLSGGGGTASIQSIDSGKHYWESTAHCGPDTIGFAVGITNLPGDQHFHVMSDGTKKVNPDGESFFDIGFQETYENDVFQVAVDMNKKEIFFGKNGIWFNSSDPALALNPAFINIPNEVKAFHTMGSRECTTLSATTNFGNSAFKYDVPVGYFMGFCPSGNCPVSEPDTDGDGAVNSIDLDDDNDGIEDAFDAFPLDPEEQLDHDNDGIGNNVDTDDDGDGVHDELDQFPHDSNESADSDGDGVGDNADFFPNSAEYSLDSDLDQMPDAWERKYGLNPTDASDALLDQDNDGLTALEEYEAGTIPLKILDIDADGNVDALTDGLIILRYLFNLRGDNLVNGAVAENAMRTEAADVEAYIQSLMPSF